MPWLIISFGLRNSWLIYLSNMDNIVDSIWQMRLDRSSMDGTSKVELTDWCEHEPPIISFQNDVWYHQLTYLPHMIWPGPDIFAIYLLYLNVSWLTTWPLASARFDHYLRQNRITPCSNLHWLRQLPIASHSSEFQYISLDHLLGRYMHMYMYLDWYAKNLLISSYSYIPLTTLLDHCISSNDHKPLPGTPIPLVAGPYFPPPLSLSLTTHCVDYLVTYSIILSHRHISYTLQF